jgi:CheY-like chemotaxis protein
MDVRVPEMNGLLGAQEIRRRWPANGLKIIAITAYALERQEKCLEAGMDNYIASCTVGRACSGPEEVHLKAQ